MFALNCFFVSWCVCVGCGVYMLGQTCEAGPGVAVETYLPWRQSSTGEE